MSFNDGSRDDDITKAETPNALFRQLLEHLQGVEESVKKVFPRIERSQGVDKFLVRSLADQLDELGSAAGDLAAALRIEYLRKR